MESRPSIDPCSRCGHVCTRVSRYSSFICQGPAQPGQSSTPPPSPRSGDEERNAYDVRCHEDMGSDPCGKPAVAYRIDPEFGSRYPVCKAHDRP